jgi:ABC-type sugar transport system permease subunit
MSIIQPSVERRSLRGWQKMRTEARPNSPVWLLILNTLFYVLLVVAILWFIYYLYSFFQLDQGRLLRYLPVLFQGAAVTIVLSIVSVILATIFGFIGALGRLSRFVPIRWLATT